MKHLLKMIVLILIIGILPMKILAEEPSITITEHGRTLSSNDIISSSPQIDIRITTSIVSVDAASTQIKLGSTTVTSNLTTIESSSYIFEVLYTPSLSTGYYNISVQALDIGGKLSFVQLENLHVRSDTAVIGIPKNYPNPFSPSSSQSTTLNYTLSKNADIRLVIYDIAGRIVWQNNYASGSVGGRAGENEITWNGRTGFNEIASNGAYIFLMLTGNSLLASGEMAVYD